MTVVYQIVTEVEASGVLGPLELKLKFEECVRRLPQEVHLPVKVGKVRVASTYVRHDEGVEG